MPDFYPESNDAAGVNGAGIQVVIFDCDGVMFDTTDANTAYYNHILHHFGRCAMNGEQIAYTQAHTVDASVSYLFKDDRAAAGAAAAFRASISYTPFLAQMTMEPGLVPLLQWLRPRYRTAVATNRIDTMDRILETFGIGGYFDLVVSAMDVATAQTASGYSAKSAGSFRVHAAPGGLRRRFRPGRSGSRGSRAFFIAYGNRSLAADCHIRSLKEVENFCGSRPDEKVFGAGKQ